MTHCACGRMGKWAGQCRRKCLRAGRSRGAGNKIRSFTFPTRFVIAHWCFVFRHSWKIFWRPFSKHANTIASQTTAISSTSIHSCGTRPRGKSPTIFRSKSTRKFHRPTFRVASTRTRFFWPPVRMCIRPQPRVASHWSTCIRRCKTEMLYRAIRCMRTTLNEYRNCWIEIRFSSIFNFYHYKISASNQEILYIWMPLK